MSRSIAEDASVDALLDEASSGTQIDGLRVSNHHDGWTVSVPGRTKGRLSRRAARHILSDHPQVVANWHFWNRVADEGPAAVAFLRWVERAEELPIDRRLDRLETGIVRTWGELAIRTTVRESQTREYEVCHEADRNTAADQLETHHDPTDVRSIATYDDRGRYRPLKTAPTLPTGWRFARLEAPQLLQTVEFFYPATVANWHREREGRLDVTHFRETAIRQTGIYDLVDELTSDQLRYLTEACCVDSQCLRRRAWDEDAGTSIDVPRGNGEFPCREPCSLVIAAARQVVTVEGETPREYTFELTPSEKNQLEALIDAVAEDRIDDIREAAFEEAANRYRVRYLRAKRLTETGLCDVPTFEDGPD